MIIRSNKEKWTTVDNTWVKDVTLSAKAKGILLYILSLPDDWDLHVTELVTHFTDGEKSIRSGMLELTNLGYLFCIPKHAEDGKFLGNDYVIMEDPRSELPHAQNGDTANSRILSTKERLITNNKLCATPEQKEIVAYLNEKLGKIPPKGFKDNNQQTLKLLNARLKDYTKADILAVIDVKCEKWLDNKMREYLRPITLFNVNKFESYINEIDVEGSESRHGGAMPLQMLE